MCELRGRHLPRRREHGEGSVRKRHLGPRRELGHSLHRVDEVLLLVRLGTVAGCRGSDENVFFAQERELALREVMELAVGNPSAHPLRRVRSAVDPKAVNHVLTRWTSALCETFSGKPIAIKAESIHKTLEASNDAESGAAIHLVNAWVCENQRVLGHCATSVKSNETSP